jgi:hypothetical protein
MEPDAKHVAGNPAGMIALDCDVLRARKPEDLDLLGVPMAQRGERPRCGE